MLLFTQNFLLITFLLWVGDPTINHKYSRLMTYDLRLMTYDLRLMTYDLRLMTYDL